MEISVHNELKRLVALGGSDPGFYLLALHAFIEGYCNKLNPGFTIYAKFFDVIDYLIEYLEKQQKLNSEDRRFLIRIAKEHDLSNKVRHQFQELTVDEAVSATHNFLGFCRAFSISDSALRDLEMTLNLWKTNKNPMEILRELEHTRYILSEKEKTEKSFQTKLQELEELKARFQNTMDQVSLYERELSVLKATSQHRGNKIDELRNKLDEVSKQRDDVLIAMEKYSDIDTYLDYLERFSMYTRTRLDYEQSIIHLNIEQEEIVTMLHDRGDYIIKGGAGTGKTLVLMHALENHLAMKESSLLPEDTQKMILLTYTNTLVKYSRYLASIVGRNRIAPYISTVDSFLLGILKESIENSWIDFKAPRNIIHDYNTTSFFSDEELSVEIEEVIWGNLLTREEYVEKHILRKGMKQPLNQQQRTFIWGIQESLRDALRVSKGYSRNLAALELSCFFDQNAFFKDRHEVDRIYIDEAQDFSTAVIHVMKSIARGGVVLAADDGQSIYRIGTPYLRASLNIAGHVRMLKSNFRNTKQIYDFAESISNIREDSISQIPEASEKKLILREGPYPEIVAEDNEEKLYESLLRYINLATKRLGYDPENIGILAPTNTLLDSIKDRLLKEEIVCENIKKEGFDFLKQGIIRLSTLHSSKGLEFPVVMLFIPDIIDQGDYDERHMMTIQQNLLYVAITRAMDYVVLFVLRNAKNGILNKVIELNSKTNSVQVEK